MSGIPNWNFPAFHDAAARIRATGHGVLNPAEFGAHPSQTWADCLKRDLALLVHCGVVVTLDNWVLSKGARLEVHVARELGMPVVPLDEFLKNGGIG